MSDQHARLNDDELAELDAFLLSDQCDGEALSLDEVHGYLTARLVSGTASDEAQWLAEVWGEPQFDDAAQRERLSELMRRLRQDIADTLARGARFEPLAVEVDDEEESGIAYEGWCYGFMVAVDADHERWEALPKAEAELLTPIAQLALLNDEEAEEMSDEEYQQWVELLPGSVRGLYAHWQAG